MSWITTTNDGNWYIGPPRLPGRLGQALFPPRIMHPESRVLLLGSASIFEPWLNWLGIACTKLQNADASSLKSIPDSEFEVVLTRDLPPYLSSLCGGEAYQQTAELICKVRPGGRLVLLSRCEPTGVGFPTGHLRGCYARHMGAFDGLCQVKLFGDPWSNWKSWNWLIGLQPRSGYLATTLQLPLESLPREYWFSKATAATHRESQPCCLWSRQQLQQSDANSAVLNAA